jgi:hypothetical protein
MVELSEKQEKLIELKSQGMKNKDIAAILYPEATEHAGAVIISRELQKPHVAKYVQQGRDAILKKYDINWNTIIAKLVIMLNAEKTDGLTGEIKPDYVLQLQVIKTILPMLDKANPQQNPIKNYPELQRALDKGNEVELQRLVFKKNEPITNP